VHLKGANSMAASEFSCRKSLFSTVGAISLLHCTNGLRKWSSGHVRPPISDCEALVSQSCTGSLQRYLCEVRNFKTHL